MSDPDNVKRIYLHQLPNVGELIGKLSLEDCRGIIAALEEGRVPKFRIVAAPSGLNIDLDEVQANLLAKLKQRVATLQRH